MSFQLVQMRYLIFVFIIAILLPNSFAQQSECDYKVEILINGTEFDKESFIWRMRAIKIEGKTTNITGTARIEDTNGKIVKSYKPWTNTSISKQKTSSEYTPNLKEGEYKITAEINVECNDINKDNNIDVKAIKIKSEEELKKADNNIKQSSEINTINKSDLKFNNNNSKIINENNNSEKTQNQESKRLMVDEEADNVIQLKPAIIPTAAIVKEPETVYKSSNEKAKDLILISLLILSVSLNIVLIWRR